MSGPAIEELRRRFGTNPKLEAIYDPDGAMHNVGGDYTLLIFVSVLHHIPNYIPFLEKASERIVSGGTLLTLQDPMWYSRHRLAHRAEQAAYFTWRLGVGSPISGLRTRLRRIGGIFDETNPRDVVEYHVVRNGVDEEEILAFACGAFAEVELISYWSSQLGVAQSLGERLGLQNSFGVVAHGYHSGGSRQARASFSTPATHSVIAVDSRSVRRHG
jgi:hypothetical protein